MSEGMQHMTRKRQFFRITLPVLAGAFVLFALTDAALAATPGLDLEGIARSAESGPLTARIIQFLGLLTVLSIAPGLLIMVTCFTRIVVVLSFLRSGLGLQQSPPNMVMVSLALFITAYVMAPTFDRAWRDGLNPLLNDRISQDQAFERMVTPFRAFMISNVREKDLAMFQDLFDTVYKKSEAAMKNNGPEESMQPARPEQIAQSVDLRVLIPAFLISELRRAFEIGFLVFLPFLVIDLVIATVLMAMGMMMLPPVVISLPFKILFFVLIDGWYLLSSSLIRSFS